MTKQEAVEAIKMAIAQVEWEYPMDYAVAFDMAIEALSQPEIVRCKECRWHEMRREMLLCKAEDKPHTYDWYCAGGEKTGETK